MSIFNKNNENELIAVLTAAVIAAMGGTGLSGGSPSAGNLKIKSYRRVPNNLPAWNIAGRNDVINSRNMA